MILEGAFSRCFCHGAATLPAPLGHLLVLWRTPSVKRFGESVQSVCYHPGEHPLGGDLVFVSWPCARLHSDGQLVSPAGPICCRPDTQPVQLHSMGMPPAHCEWRRYANPSRHIDCRRQGTCRMLDTTALPAGSHGENDVCPCTQASAVRQGFGVMHDRTRRRAVGRRSPSDVAVTYAVRCAVTGRVIPQHAENGHDTVTEQLAVRLWCCYFAVTNTA